MKLLLIILLSSTQLWASFPELFAPSSGTMAIGGQAETNSAANNYYAGALLGFSNKTLFSFNYFYVNSNFKPINDVVIKNESNTVNEFLIGDVEINQTPTSILGAHLSLPLFSPEGPKLNLSVMSPIDRLLEADTGDPYQPNYVMYSTRFLRPSLNFSIAQAFNDWAFSLGAMTGVQSNGETYAVTKTTSNTPSLAKISFNAKPSLGINTSAAKKSGNHKTYLSFQQEMKSKLSSRATGETEIGSNGSLPFDFDINSLLYYDPMIIRLGHQIQFNTSTFHVSLEYQNWTSYETSTLDLSKKGGLINGSYNYEDVTTRNIFIPKFGITKKLTDHWSTAAGYFFRPSPLSSSHLKNAGNSIDVDKHVVSTGITRSIKIFNVDANLDLSYQAHLLKSSTITKTSGQEDAVGPDPKIGSPGYRVGGIIHVVALGFSWMY